MKIPLDDLKKMMELADSLNRGSELRTLGVLIEVYCMGFEADIRELD